MGMNWTSFMVGVIFGAFIMMVIATIYALRDIFTDNKFEKGYRVGYEHGALLKQVLENKEKPKQEGR